MQNATILHHGDAIRTPNGHIGYLQTIPGIYRARGTNDEKFIARRVGDAERRGSPIAYAVRSEQPAHHNAIGISEGEVVVVDGIRLKAHLSYAPFSNFVDMHLSYED